MTGWAEFQWECDRVWQSDTCTNTCNFVPNEVTTCCWGWIAGLRKIPNVLLLYSMYSGIGHQGQSADPDFLDLDTSVRISVFSSLRTMVEHWTCTNWHLRKMLNGAVTYPKSLSHLPIQLTCDDHAYFWPDSTKFSSAEVANACQGRGSFPTTG